MARVFITGANGHIGAHTTREVLKRGHEVVPFVRKTSDLRGLEGLNLDYHYGDIMDPASVEAAVAGCDTVIHLAAVYKVWDSDDRAILDPALIGVRNVFEAGQKAGVRRLIYVSSAASVGSSRNPDDLRTSEDWNDEAENAYYVGKTNSEREAWKLAESSGIPMLSFCPTFVLGPLDYRVTPSNGFIRDLLDGDQTTYPGGINLVHVQDVAFVLASAVERGTPGGRYIVAGTNTLLTELREMLRQMTGIRPGHLSVPRPAALMTGSLVEALARVTGGTPRFSRSIIHELFGRYSVYEYAKTLETFDYQPIDRKTTLQDCIDWLVEIEALKPRTIKRIQAHRAE